MTAPPYRPQKVLIEEAVRDHGRVAEILSRLSGVPTEEVRNPKTLVDRFQKTSDPIGEGKRSLLLARDRGRAFKPFPTPEGTLSSDFYSLHLVEGCDLECSYCILQAYLTNPLLTVYVNTEEVLGRLDSFLKGREDRFFRIGTGQLADSLSLDHLTAHSELLVPFFARQKNARLELKTKSVNIARLEKLDPAGKTIVSWSLNTPRIQGAEEHKTAGIEERLRAAGQCLGWGYGVGFHLDPLIDYPGCEEEYERLIEKLFSNIAPEKITWISLGTLRFLPELKSIMEKRFPASPLPAGEWVPGLDGKLRYFKNRRVELYRRLREKFRKEAPGLTLYLCMETPEVWEKTFGRATSPNEMIECLNRSALIS